MLGYRDSGMPDSEANANPACFARAPLEEAVGRLVAIIRRERPQVIVTYAEDQQGYPHPDHLRVPRDLGGRLRRRRRPRRLTPTPESPSSRSSSITSAGRRPGSSPCTRSSSSSAWSRPSTTPGSSGPPTDPPYTTAIDISGYGDIRRQALLAHATQVDPDLPVLVRAAARGGPRPSTPSTSTSWPGPSVGRRARRAVTRMACIGGRPVRRCAGPRRSVTCPRRGHSR